NPSKFSQNGLGFDNRSRIDLFISQTHAALFQDGHLLVQSDIPAGSFPWFNQPLKVYFTHYLYHTAAERLEMLGSGPRWPYGCYLANGYIFNDPVTGTTLAENSQCGFALPPGFGFQNSDERHWDNMGFEVLPTSIAPANDYSSLVSLVQLP